jgi:CheY-like chemotaxis protein
LLLHSRPEWQIVCEVSDGAEAVQKADELKPDLILLDIGLPNLNGIEAARRIRQLSPSSKILFLSTDDSQDLVHAAMSTGVYGYVYKARARSELLPAIDAVLRGEQYVSCPLRVHKIADSAGAKVSHFHEVLFYSDDAVFLERFTRFIAAALAAGDVAVIISSEAHRNCFVHRLKAHGLDIDATMREGRFILLDVAKTLSTFMVNDVPDSNRLFEVVASLVTSAAKAGNKEHPRVAVCGEGVSILCETGKLDAAIRLEHLWNQLARSYEIDILCGYSLSGFHGEKDKNAFQRICAEHSAVYSQ